MSHAIEQAAPLENGHCHIFAPTHPIDVVESAILGFWDMRNPNLLSDCQEFRFKAPKPRMSLSPPNRRLKHAHARLLATTLKLSSSIDVSSAILRTQVSRKRLLCDLLGCKFPYMPIRTCELAPCTDEIYQARRSANICFGM